MTQPAELTPEPNPGSEPTDQQAEAMITEIDQHLAIRRSARAMRRRNRTIYRLISMLLLVILLLGAVYSLMIMEKLSHARPLPDAASPAPAPEP